MTKYRYSVPLRLTVLLKNFPPSYPFFRFLPEIQLLTISEVTEHNKNKTKKFRRAYVLYNVHVRVCLHHCIMHMHIFWLLYNWCMYCMQEPYAWSRGWWAPRYAAGWHKQLQQKGKKPISSKNFKICLNNSKRLNNSKKWYKMTGLLNRSWSPPCTKRRAVAPL